MSLRTLLAGGAAALLTGAASLVPLVAAPAPASAAACSTQTGVSVVVDFDELGGGVRTVCLPGGGGDLASTLFPAAGYPLKYAQRQPGFVCRVSDVPKSDPCVNTSPADAYWSLWVSDGGAGAGWRYAAAGAASLRIADGQLVAFHWNQGGGQQPPAASAQRPAPPAAPADPGGSGSGGSGGGGGGNGSAGSSGGSGTRQPGAPSGSASPGDADPSDGPSDGPSGGTGAGGQEGTGPADPAPSAGASGRDGGRDGKAARGRGSRDGGKRQPTGAPSAAPGAGATTGADQTDRAEPLEEPGSREVGASSDAASDGLPGWVAPGVLGLLVVAAGATLLARRRSSGRP